MSIRKFLAFGAAVAAGLTLAGAPPAAAQTKVEWKLGHFVPPTHPFSRWLDEWAKLVAEKSKGALTITILPAAQMGPGTRYYELARTGQADVTWIVHGFTPNVFPLTEISNMPYLFGSAEIGSKVMNEWELRKLLEPEHKGVKVLLLFTHQPGNVHSAKKPIRTVADLRGMRIRFPSSVVRDLVKELGGNPVLIASPEIVENMQKGTLDGAFIDYGGAGLAFRMGPVTKYTTELYMYVTSFGLIANEKSFEALTPELRKLVADTIEEKGGGGEAGRRFDSIDAPGKDAMVKAGTEIIKFSAEEDKKMRAAAAKITAQIISDMDKKGMPASAVYKLMQDLAKKHEANSKNFWK
jgi:TRAP-type C4-dicarboxylate transport system substrate-binding protein